MDHEPTSNLQDGIYAFIVECVKAEGIPPTIREIGQKMQITSTCTSKTARGRFL